MEYYIGDPEKSRQCYRQMSVDNDYCLDPQTQSECNREPQLLMDGQAVFFVVLPKFMNVDIRIIIDITQGKTFAFLPQLKMLRGGTSEASGAPSYSLHVGNQKRSTAESGDRCAQRPKT